MKVMAHRSRTEGDWLVEEERDIPGPGQGEVLVRIEACGVCRTDLHIVEGDLPEMVPGIVPGHEVVGVVEQVGKGVSHFARGDRAGIMWLHGTCGKCQYCLSGRENLCSSKEFTGYTVDGGYAEFALAREGFLLPISQGMDAVEAAPLLCSGIIGYRALKLAMPPPGGRLGIFGFGGSAHLTLQAASGIGLDVGVVSRGDAHLDLAKRLGASEVWKSGSTAGKELAGRFDTAIVFAPAGEVVSLALESVKPGGRVAVPAVHLDRVPEMSYREHLFREKSLFSVEANTRADAREFLALASRLGIRSETDSIPLARANEGLRRLKHGKVNGAEVLTVT